jgi:hypothetical protein
MMAPQMGDSNLLAKRGVRATGAWRRPRAGGRRGLPALDGFDLAVLVAFAGLSVWVLWLAIAQATAHGLAWTGTDGIGVQDQMQYVAWIRDASQHGLASNLFTLTPSPHDYLQPLVEISALIAALGVAPWVTLLLWKPVAVGASFFAIRAFIRRSVADRTKCRVALVLALFFVPGVLVAQVVGHLHLVSGAPLARFTYVADDSWVGFYSWGYPWGLLALAAMVAALLTYDRERQRKRIGGLSPVLGALASWLHPWQGGTLIVLLIATEAVSCARTGERPPVRQLFLTSAFTALPLVYYSVLAHLDPSWRLADASVQTPGLLWIVPLSELPLALLAVFAYARRPLTFLDRATRLWPIVALALCVFCIWTGTGGFVLHFFFDVNIPLSILAINGCSGLTARRTSRRLPGLGWVAIGVLVVVPLAAQLRFASQAVSASAQRPPPQGGGDAQFVTPGELRALGYLASAPGNGGVLTSSYLGAVVPAESGRATYVGDSFWSPAYAARVAATDDLFQGQLPATAARDFVRGTGARFVLADCSSRQDRLVTELAPLIAAIRRFGCASVYVLR